LERKADHTLDFRGTLTPITLLKATQLLKEMRTSETMEILGCDLDTLSDLLKVLPAPCYEVTSMGAGEEGGALYRIELKKIKDS
jgi:TusA-related sulfurtransferase